MDYFSSECSLFCKVKTMVSSFFGLLLWVSSFQFPMQTQKPRPVVQSQFSLLGLKTLILSGRDEEEDEEEKSPHVIRSVGVGIVKSMLLTPPSPPCSIRSCSVMDDLIGTESGVCLTSNAEEMDKKSTQPYRPHLRINQNDLRKQNQRCAAKKQFPPPIPFLVQSGNRPSQIRTPWVLTRHYMEGRLILKLERVRHHQYLESHRENGRLILKLVPTPIAVADGTEEDDQDLQFIEEDGAEKEEKTEWEDTESIDYQESEEIEEATDSAMAFKSFTYGGEGCGVGMFCDRNSLCGGGVNGNIEERHIDHGYFGSASLRPMGTVT